jgi:hypothetical protein
MSNTRRPKWTTSQITAGNAEALLGELAESVAGEDPVTRSMLLAVWDRLDAEGRAGEFPALAERVRADVAREVAGGRFLAELEAGGADPGVIALARRRLAALGVDYWAARYREIKGLAPR